MAETHTPTIKQIVSKLHRLGFNEVEEETKRTKQKSHLYETQDNKKLVGVREQKVLYGKQKKK